MEKERGGRGKRKGGEGRERRVRERYFEFLSLVKSYIRVTQERIESFLSPVWLTRWVARFLGKEIFWTLAKMGFKYQTLPHTGLLCNAEIA